MRPLRFSRWVASALGLRIWMDRGPALGVPRRRTSLGRASTWVGTGSERCREGRCGPSGPFCYSPALSWLGPDRGVRQGMPPVARVPSFRPAVQCGGLLAVLRDGCRSLGWWSRTMPLGCWRSYGCIRPVLKHGPRSLTCARVLGCVKPRGAMKVKAAPAAEVRSAAPSKGRRRIIDRPILLLGRFE